MVAAVLSTVYNLRATTLIHAFDGVKEKIWRPGFPQELF
jgi:hypothetical protein